MGAAEKIVEAVEVNKDAAAEFELAEDPQAAAEIHDAAAEELTQTFTEFQSFHQGVESAIEKEEKIVAPVEAECQCQESEPCGCNQETPAVQIVVQGPCGGQEPCDQTTAP